MSEGHWSDDKTFEEAPASAWRPIATAPKDGTDIWLGAHGDGDPRRQRVSIGYWALKGEWRSYADDDQIFWKPTHWQPFLEPPAPPSRVQAVGE